MDRYTHLANEMFGTYPFTRQAIRESMHAKRRRAKNAFITRVGPSHHVAFWPRAAGICPVDTTCRVCQTAILRGDPAYVGRGETYCAEHFPKDLPSSFQLHRYTARWTSACMWCDRVIRPGDTLVWRSRSWHLHHGKDAGVLVALGVA